MGLVIYHNPSCATSRKVLGMIRAAGIEPAIVLYLKEPLTKAGLTELLARLGLSPRAILRRRGTPYDELGLGDASLPEEALIEAMLKHPILIERPIVANEAKAVLCRPPERVLELLPGAAKSPQATPANAKPTQAKPTQAKPTQAKPTKAKPRPA